MSVNKNVTIKFQNSPAADPTVAVVVFEGLLEVPGAGTTGHILVKTATGYEFQAAPKELPVGGTEGQVLAKNAEGALVWVTPAAAPLPVFSSAAIAELANGDYKLHIVDGVPTWVAIV